jgi:hypothetical protein
MNHLNYIHFLNYINFHQIIQASNSTHEFQASPIASIDLTGASTPTSVPTASDSYVDPAVSLSNHTESPTQPTDLSAAADVVSTSPSSSTLRTATPQPVTASPTFPLPPTVVPTHRPTSASAPKVTPTSIPTKAVPAQSATPKPTMSVKSTLTTTPRSLLPDIPDFTANISGVFRGVWTRMNELPVAQQPQSQSQPRPHDGFDEAEPEVPPALRSKRGSAVYRLQVTNTTYPPIQVIVVSARADYYSPFAHEICTCQAIFQKSSSQSSQS